MSSDKLKIQTRYLFGFPYHRIMCGDTVVVNLVEQNYKLAKKIKKVLSKNPDLIFNKKKNDK